MASKRRRGNSWEFTIKRAALLPKPVTLTFASEQEGDAYCARIEALLDRGVVAPDLLAGAESRTTSLQELVLRYTCEARVSPKDQEQLTALLRTPRAGETRLTSINVAWVDELIRGLKHEGHRAPATIRARVGALARCTDWAVRKGLMVMPDNPFRTLPRGYASYSEIDAAVSGGAREDVERDRRLDHAGKEEAAILAVIDSGTLKRKLRPRTLEHVQHIRTLFLLALETAMRMSEMLTLTWDQVQIPRKIVWLDRTKNGDSRAVPLTTVAVQLLQELPRDTEFVFPWWGGSFDQKKMKIMKNFVSKLYADIFEAAGCPDLRFHDLRHEATSRLFERTNIQAERIMKITGHKSHRMFMRYLKLRESDIANELW